MIAMHVTKLNFRKLSLKACESVPFHFFLCVYRGKKKEKKLFNQFSGAGSYSPPDTETDTAGGTIPGMLSVSPDRSISFSTYILTMLSEQTITVSFSLLLLFEKKSFSRRFWIGWLMFVLQISI